MVLRYLAAFGPASVKDAQAWSGLTRLAEVFERLRPGLINFVNAKGTEVFDLPDAPRPTSGTPPVRILAPFDNILLSHADRSRIMDEQYRTRVFTVNGIIKPAILVRGKVVGYATVTPAKETVELGATLFAQQPKTALASIEKEARSLLKFMAPEDPEPRGSLHCIYVAGLCFRGARSRSSATISSFHMWRRTNRYQLPGDPQVRLGIGVLGQHVGAPQHSHDGEKLLAEPAPGDRVSAEELTLFLHEPKTPRLHALTEFGVLPRVGDLDSFAFVNPAAERE